MTPDYAGMTNLCVCEGGLKSRGLKSRACGWGEGGVGQGWLGIVDP